MLHQEVFAIWDYLVVGGMLMVSIIIGIYFRFSGDKQRTTNEYLMAGRDMAIFPVVLSLMATVQTAVGTLGFPGEVYLYGSQLFIYPLGVSLALVVSAYIHTPVYFGLQVTSAYEYLEKRFGRLTRTLISGLFILQMVLFMSVGLYSPSIALSAVSGLSHLVSVLTVGTVCAFYCTMGGMKAVLWTDVFQSILMFFALLSVIIKGTIDVGGIQNMLHIAREGSRLNFNFTFDPTLRFTFLSTLVGGFMYGITTTGANQTQVQRMLTLNSLKRAQLSVLLSVPMNLIMYYTIFTCGLVIYANFAGCDPLLRTEQSGISSGDELIPYYMIRSFVSFPGMAGFCVSGVFCAALTSISSAVNSLAAVTYEDFVKPFCKCNALASEKAAARMTKFFALFYSALCIAMTYLVGNIKAIIPAAFVVFTAIGGPTLSIITLGMLSTTANQKGVIVGFVSGIILNGWIGAGSIISQFPQIKLPQTTDQCLMNATEINHNATTVISTMEYSSTMSELQEEVFPLFKLSFLLHPVPGTILTLFIGYLISLITGPDRNVDENLICPFMKKYLLPGKTKTEEKLASNGLIPDEMQQNQDLNNHPCNKNSNTANMKSKNAVEEETKL